MSRLGVEPGPMMTLTVAMALGVKLITRDLQMDALNGMGDNWEVPQGMEVNICCSELNRQRSLSIEYQDPEWKTNKNNTGNGRKELIRYRVKKEKGIIR